MAPSCPPACKPHKHLILINRFLSVTLCFPKFFLHWGPKNWSSSFGASKTHFCCFKLIMKNRLRNKDADVWLLSISWETGAWSASPQLAASVSFLFVLMIFYPITRAQCFPLLGTWSSINTLWASDMLPSASTCLHSPPCLVSPLPLVSNPPSLLNWTSTTTQGPLWALSVPPDPRIPSSLHSYYNPHHCTPWALKHLFL